MAAIHTSSAPTIRTVAIIGAGPAGLVTAKELLSFNKSNKNNKNNIHFRPTIFEAGRTVGGVWGGPAHTWPNGHSDGIINPSMRINLSKWSCMYSDHLWTHPQSGRVGARGGVETDYPYAREMGEYLQTYAEKFGIMDIVEFETRVTNVERRVEGGWRVSWSKRNRTKEGGDVDEVERGDVQGAQFDHLVICSGFFSKPWMPSGVPGMNEFKQGGGEVLHSSDWRRLGDVFKPIEQKDTRGVGIGQHKSKEKQENVTVVVGGLISGVELAADLALQLRTSLSKGRKKIVHIFPRPPWVLPRYLPTPTNPPDHHPSPSFLPLDLLFYNAFYHPSPSAPPVDTKEKNIQGNTFLGGLTGNNDQSELHPALKIGKERYEYPPTTAISDVYADAVRAGDIEVLSGAYLESFNKGGVDERWNVVCVSGGREIENVERVVFATGYTPSFLFLPEDMRKELGILDYGNGNEDGDREGTFLPVLLDEHMLHPSLIRYHGLTNKDKEATVEAAFVGMYKGPFFAVMELQARYLAQLFSGSTPPPPKESLEAAIEKFRVLRDGRSKNQRAEDRDQWSHPGYLQTLEILEQRLGILESEGGVSRAVEMAKKHKWPVASVIPAHFAPVGKASEEVLREFEEYMSYATTQPRIVAKAVFRSLYGEWHVRREMSSRRKEMPSGTFEGVALFLPRTETFAIEQPDEEGGELTCSMKNLSVGAGRDEHSSTPDNAGEITEYLYAEYGTFKLSKPPHFSFPASRKYIYRYQPSTDSISVWFVKPSSSSVPTATPPSSLEEQMEGEADYLFHEVEFLHRDAQKGGQVKQGEWLARGKEHLCVQDLYKPRYRFEFGQQTSDGSGGVIVGTELAGFMIAYDVSGPKKDYSSEGSFRRRR